MKISKQAEIAASMIFASMIQAEHAERIQKAIDDHEKDLVDVARALRGMLDEPRPDTLTGIARMSHTVKLARAALERRGK
jgi:hypothetical protein